MKPSESRKIQALRSRENISCKYNPQKVYAIISGKYRHTTEERISIPGSIKRGEARTAKIKMNGKAFV